MKKQGGGLTSDHDFASKREVKGRGFKGFCSFKLGVLGSSKIQPYICCCSHCCLVATN